MIFRFRTEVRWRKIEKKQRNKAGQGSGVLF